MENTTTMADALDDLSSAEEFLDYFDIPFDPAVVQVNRLHILQRFHDYLARQDAARPDDEPALRAFYRHWLERAYADFVRSDALTEKVFRVFQNAPRPGGGSTAFVPLEKVFRS